MNPFPPPRGVFYPNIPPLPINHIPNMIPGQFPPMPPIGMVSLPPVGPLPNSPQVSSITVPTVPTGVATISAPPVRKITPSVPIQNKPTPSYQMPYLVGKQSFTNQKLKYTGPIITVFVGNINEKVSDIVIRQILDKCGNVTNWKRVKGPNGLQAFGFCDYAEADSALRAIRLLHDFEIGDKKLVVKVDAKTREKLDQYAKENSSESSSSESKEDEKNKDEKALELIKSLLKENESEIVFKTTVETDESSNNSVSNNLQNQNKNQIPAEPNLQNFSDMDIEEEKKTLIHREIGKFRSTYKKQDEENEKLEAERQRERELRRERERERNRRSSSRDRKLESSSISRYERERERENRYDRSRIDRLERNEREINSRSVYEDDETIEQRRQLREERRKEESYQKRLKEWECREERKKRQYEKEKFRLIEKKKEEERELLKLKQFLEDYNDDLDDIKYYKGSNFVRKLRDYEKEREDDERDRHLEKKELDELRRKLQEEGHPDPESEAKKLMSSVNKSTINKLTNEQVNNGHNLIQQQNNEEIHVKSFTLTKQDNRQLNSLKNSNNNDSFDANHITPITDFQNSSSNTTQDKIKKKQTLSVHDVFNSNEDDDKSQISKKRKLPVFIDDNTDSNQSLTSNLNSRGEKNSSSNDSKSQNNSDDKRKQIKALIDNIPTTKEELFRYEIEWDYVDANLMEKRIRPWINKKITEYIGEEEKALLDFICGKLNARCNAQSILDDVAMVLDDEAEVFIVKMLRLLIYEIEAKKLGLGK